MLIEQVFHPPEQLQPLGERIGGADIDDRVGFQGRAKRIAQSVIAGVRR